VHSGRDRTRVFLAALCFLFFFSGACALVYQVLWLRTLGWVFGVTVYAGPGEVLTDDRPLVEYFLSLPRDHDVDLSALKGDVSRFVDAE
jgi:hypothetical protein